MPLKSLIDTKAAAKTLKQFSESLDGRVDALKRYVGMRMTESLRDEIESAAPKGLPGLPNDYPDLEIAMVKDLKDLSYAAIYIGSATQASTLDPETTVIYPRRFKENDKRKKAAAVAELESLGPFVLDTLPASIDRSVGYFSYRRVTPDEAMAVMEKNGQDRDRIKRVVEAHGLDPKVDRNALMAYSDLAFQVLRLEFGLAGPSRPHWRPAVREVAQGSTLTAILGEKAVGQTLSSVTFQGWRRLGMINRAITLNELNPQFIKRILG